MSSSKSMIEIFGLNPPKQLPIGVKYMAEHPVLPTCTNDFTDQLIGIEVEVENTLQNDKIPLHRAWTIKEDGSLRNNGREYVTAPIAAAHAPYLLKNLLKEVLDPQCCFSPRTSIHVHFNVGHYTDDQIRNIVLSYSALEPLFYRFIGRGRAKNIFCVPLIETGLLYNLTYTPIAGIVNSWSKYTGLNLLPIGTFGTIEARHMHGTFNVEKVSIWIRLWCKLIKWSVSLKTKELQSRLSDLRGDTQVVKWLHEVFESDWEFLKYRGYGDLKRSLTNLCLADATEKIYKEIVVERDTQKSPWFKFKVSSSKGL